MTMWKRLAKMIGVRSDQVEDALHDEQRARRQMDRRGFIAAASTVAAAPLLPKRIYSIPLRTKYARGTPAEMIHPLGGGAEYLALWIHVR